MSESYFEKLVHGEMAKIQAAMLTVSLEEPTKGLVQVARFQGRYQQCQEMLDLYRKAVRTDIEADAA